MTIARVPLLVLPAMLVFASSACAPSIDRTPIARTTPTLPMPPGTPAEGTGRVLIDVENAQANDHVVVSEVALRQFDVGKDTPQKYGRGKNDLYNLVGRERVARRLCESTPCVVDLALGSHELMFHAPSGREDTTFVVASPNGAPTTRGSLF
jgi:hypothetical protein